ncbi:flagellin [Planctomycetota bacterium]|nr:flagellin [Planctomycetota bacterium]
MTAPISGSQSSSSVNYLSNHNRALELTLAKLSSAQRINQAADDPAGLVISEQLAAILGGTEQASDNIATDVSLLQTADGGLSQTSELLNKQRAVALQAANSATLDDGQRAALDAQYRNLGESIDRIAKNTSFGNKPLLDGSFKQTFQVGPDGGSSVKIDLTSKASGKPAGFDQAGLGLADVSLSTPTGVSDALTRLDTAINEVANQRGSLGALQANTLEAYGRSMEQAKINLTGAYSTIRDTDMASSAADFARNSILAQSGYAALAQQNLAGNRILSLLG